MLDRGSFNKSQIIDAARALGDLKDEVVFLGGATTVLLVTDAAAPEPRATKDVDVVVAVGSRTAYYRVESRLRALGFAQKQLGNDPICRWYRENVVVDVMPTDEEILGFSNAWYPDAVETATTVELEAGLAIRLVTAPLFVCTKMEAFLGRGEGDFMLSQDIQDIVFVVDGRAELVLEVRSSSAPVQAYISRTFSGWLAAPRFLDSLPGHLPFDAASQARYPLVLERIQHLARPHSSTMPGS